MRTLILVAVLLSSTTFAQSMFGRDEPNWALYEHATSFAVPSAPKIPVIRASVAGWAMEGSGYQLRCDQVAQTCQTAMLRSAGASKTSTAQFVHRESALPWRGVQLTFRAELRVGQVGDGVRLVMRAEDLNGTELTRAVSRPLQGTTSFAWESINLQVPEGAERVTFAIELSGTGAVFFRELLVDDAQLFASAP